MVVMAFLALLQVAHHIHRSQPMVVRSLVSLVRPQANPTTKPPWVIAIDPPIALRHSSWRPATRIAVAASLSLSFIPDLGRTAVRPHGP